MRELARTLLESVVNEVMNAKAAMPCEDGADARDGHRGRGLPPRRRHRPTHAQAESRRLLPRGHNRALLARRPGGGCGVAGKWCLGEEDGENRPKMGMEVLSKDRVGAMCRSLDAEVGELASRDLGGIEVPTLLLDAAYVKCGRGGPRAAHGRRHRHRRRVRLRAPHVRRRAPHLFRVHAQAG